MPDGDLKRYLVGIQFAPHTSVAELAKLVPGIQNFLAQLCSRDEMTQFFRSTEGNTFGLFFKSGKPLPLIRSVLDGATTNADSFLVVEVGKEAAAKGFGRALTWLQHH